MAAVAVAKYQTNDTSVKEIKRKMKKANVIVRARAESMRDNTFQCARRQFFFSLSV